MKFRGRTLFLTLQFAMLFGCGVKIPDTSLPDSKTLGNPRNYQIARVLTHFHSPYSYDACDKHGFTDGKINQSCLNHLKKALCRNRIDFLFLTDHPDNMTNYEIRDLLLPENNDEILTEAGAPVANQMHGCDNGFSPVILAGFESQIMTFGMKKHLELSHEDRSTLYQEDTPTLSQRLKTEADALVVVPHTESKDLDWVKSIQPDAIEVYNFHASVDPKIRKRSFNAAPFEDIAGLLTYLIDPYGDLIPDLSVLNFDYVHPIYFQKWNSLIHQGVKVAGLAGTDSHENIFPQIVSDGERLDSHRRIARTVSNHYLVQNRTYSEVEEAIRKGRGWIAFEGLGTPTQMDFYATTGTATIGIGETGAIQQQKAVITIQSPVLSPDTLPGKESPVIRLRLKKVLADGKDVLLQESENGSNLQFTTAEAGSYRAEISIIPKHLRKYLGDFSDKADHEFPWIITNHIHLTQ